MNQLADPGKGKPPAEAKAARNEAWARPSTKAVITRRHNERLDDWIATVPAQHREHLRKAVGR